MPGYSVENGFEMASVPVSALFLVLCGLCTSIMWGGIFNLAVEGLGKYNRTSFRYFYDDGCRWRYLPIIAAIHF